MSAVWSVSVVRHVAAEHRDRTCEDDARRRRQFTAGFEHGAGAVEIDMHAEIEIGFRGSAHHRCQMKHAAVSGVMKLATNLSIGNIARQCLQARIRLRKERGLDDIDEHQLLDSLRLAVAPTSSPRSRSLRARCRPMKPAPPVMTTRI